MKKKKTNEVIFYKYIVDIMFNSRQLGKPIIDFTDTSHYEDTDQDYYRWLDHVKSRLMYGKHYYVFSKYMGQGLDAEFLRMDDIHDLGGDVMVFELNAERFEEIFPEDMAHNYLMYEGADDIVYIPLEDVDTFNYDAGLVIYEYKREFSQEQGAGGKKKTRKTRKTRKTKKKNI